MITEFKIDEMDKVQLIPEPKHVWVDVDRIVVYIGSDIPSAPIADEEIL